MVFQILHSTKFHSNVFFKSVKLATYAEREINTKVAFRGG